MGLNDTVVSAGGDTLSESQTILRNSVNNHFWYGILSTLKIDLSDHFDLMVGIDGNTPQLQHVFGVLTG